MAISKKLILNIIIVIWIVFSVIYIFYDFWTDFKLKILNQAYQQGRIDTINTLINQAKKCEPIPIFSGEERIEVININCLEAPQKE
ncbi:hypothetical protein AMJ49_02455 [Parcubacteria bacterium DG_74_2]|nr:MAG: hypothetical protein AMJ49_02455 [Parcubacteria bacterium DG_74_2]